MKNRMELTKQNILTEEEKLKNEKILQEKKQRQDVSIQEEKIKKINDYIKQELEDCHDKNIKILPNSKEFQNIIAFNIDGKPRYVRIEYKSWEDRMSDESSPQTLSKFVLGLYPPGWEARPEVSYDLPTRYYEYFDHPELKSMIDNFINDVYNFLAKRSLEIAR